MIQVEDAKVKLYSVTCDGCKEQTMKYLTQEGAEFHVEFNNWFNRHGVHLCPKCKLDRDKQAEAAA